MSDARVDTPRWPRCSRSRMSVCKPLPVTGGCTTAHNLSLSVFSRDFFFLGLGMFLVHCDCELHRIQNASLILCSDVNSSFPGCHTGALLDIQLYSGVCVCVW